MPVVVIPGKPHAEARPRARIIRRGTPDKWRVQVYNAPGNNRWRKHARDYMRDAEMVPGPLAVAIVAQFPHSRKDVRWYDKRKDADNIAKAVLDAGNGFLWKDDGNISSLWVQKVYVPRGNEGVIIEYNTIRTGVVTPWTLETFVNASESPSTTPRSE